MTEEIVKVENSVGEILDGLNKFSGGFKAIRHRIKTMEDEELIALYNQAKEISDISWLIRVIVLGTAKERAVRGDGAVRSIAQAFGIGIRMAEMDILIYESFVRDNPEFEPELPAAFYHKAIGAPDPNKAIEFAIEQRQSIPGWPASEFTRYVKGVMPKQKLAPGCYHLVQVEKSDLEVAKLDFDETELFGRIKISSIGGNVYAEVK